MSRRADRFVWQETEVQQSMSWSTNTARESFKRQDSHPSDASLVGQWRSSQGYRLIGDAEDIAWKQESSLRTSSRPYEELPQGPAPFIFGASQSKDWGARDEAIAEDQGDVLRMRNRLSRIVSSAGSRLGKRRATTIAIPPHNENAKQALPENAMEPAPVTARSRFRESISGSIRKFSSGALKGVIGKRKRSADEEELQEQPNYKRTLRGFTKSADGTHPGHQILTRQSALQQLQAKLTESSKIHPGFRDRQVDLETLDALEGKTNPQQVLSGAHGAAYASLLAQGYNSGIALTLAVDGAEARTADTRLGLRTGMHLGPDSDSETEDWAEGNADEYRKYVIWAER